jgi:hypothetical protein
MEDDVDKQPKYTTFPDDEEVFLYLKAMECPHEKEGWKIHISLLEKGDNVGKAWGYVQEILKRRKVNLSKVLITGNTLNEFQTGKEITIYYQDSPSIDWASMLFEITNVFIDKEIKPGPKPIIDKQIEGSSYFSCRKDRDSDGKEVSAYQVDSYKPSGSDDHLFEGLKIDESKIEGKKPKKPIRNKEEEKEIKKCYQRVDSLLNKTNNLIYDSLKEKKIGEKPSKESDSSGIFDEEYKARIDWKSGNVVEDIINFIKELFKGLDLKKENELREYLENIKQYYDFFQGEGFEILEKVDKGNMDNFNTEIETLEIEKESFAHDIEELVSNDKKKEKNEDKEKIVHYVKKEAEKEEERYSKSKKSTSESSSSKSDKDAPEEKEEKQDVEIPIPKESPRETIALSSLPDNQLREEQNPKDDSDSSSCCSNPFSKLFGKK